MSIEGKCRPRFKGIENFLRRVAFNLGNSPSQTEVKIISCIPIDVTDLQHKIILLEREIEDRAVANAGRGHTSVVQTALCTPHLTRTPSHHAPTPAPRQESASGYSSSRPNKQSVSFVCPTLQSKECDCLPPPPCVSTPCQSQVQKTAECNPCMTTPCPGECEHRGGLFKFQKSKKTLKKKDKCNTQLVYYSQLNSTSPFTEHNTTEMNKRAPKDSISSMYLADMVRKQYRPDKMVADMSDTSQFSSPVCRDMEFNQYSPCTYESDMCSCCRGQFHNVDPPRHAQNVHETNPTPAKEYSNNSMYYDTSLYDMVPVRERPLKQKNEEECPKKKEHKMKTDFRNYPEKMRMKSRFQPYVVNYHNTAPARVNHKLTRRKLPVKSINKNPKSPKRIASTRQLNPPTSTETSNTCSINCGQVYPRPCMRPIIQRIIKPPVRAVLQKNAECLTISLNNTECQTASTKSVQLEPIVPDENKTEMTLNQIKTILQSVLTEVKTSSQLKNVPDDKQTKDAVVQKGPSHNDIKACSSLLNSYSYSTPYNMNPYVMSCSRQMNPSQSMCYPPSPYSQMKCLQNYPLFIQTTGRQCACCYRNIPSVGKSAHTKQAITTATNTESTAIQEHRNKETEKLIKEIYKSLAINMDFPAKETSSSDYENLKSDNSKKRFEFKFEASRPQNVVTNCVAKNMQDTSTTPIYTNATFESNIISNAASTRTPIASRTTTENRTRPERMEYLESQTRHSSYSERIAGSERGRGIRQGRVIEQERRSERGRDAERGRGRRVPYVVELPNATTSISDDETSSSDAESDDTVVPAEEPKKKERTSLFSKVAKLFKAKPKKKTKDLDSESENESEASDSDDYQTIDSHRSAKPSKHVTYLDRRRSKVKPHSKVSYSKYYMNRDHKNDNKRRSPYMEQEYRRQFDEKLMFQRGGHKYSSERPFSNQSVQPQRAYPVYWQNYEARSMHVDTPRHNPGREIAVGQSNAENIIQPKVTCSNKGLAWLKKHKLGIHCGEQWKKFILEG